MLMLALGLGCGPHGSPYEFRIQRRAGAATQLRWKVLDHRCPLEDVRRLSETAPGYRDAQWDELAVPGGLGLTIPEAYGGTANIEKISSPNLCSVFLVTSRLYAFAVFLAHGLRQKECARGLCEGLTFFVKDFAFGVAEALGQFTHPPFCHDASRLYGPELVDLDLNRCAALALG